MSKKIGRSDKLSDVFLVLGSEYYAIARYSASVFYMPICATMFHHAIEMLLKGYLVQNHTSGELKKVGHELEKLWLMFKDKTRDTTLTRYDITVSHLDRTETLRYPDAMVDQGFVLNVRLGVQTPLELSGTSNLPQYYVNVSDLDDIALAIFSACSVNPTAYFHDIPTELKNSLPPNLLSA
jgi:hypothetical protein